MNKAISIDARKFQPSKFTTRTVWLLRVHQPYLYRMYAIAPNNTRILEKDIVLSGYRIPAGVCFQHNNDK